MTYRLQARTGILAFATVFALALALMHAAYAHAQTVTIDTGTPVVASACKVCHGRIAEVDSEMIDFTHATHIVYACSSCHLSYPHTPAGTETPDMEACWNCHGLRHGPMGLIAGEDCAKCHGDRTDTIRPASHVDDWADTPHVEPAEERLRTECAMCHTRAECDTCHDQTGVDWDSASLTYDVGDGCLACHGNPELMKASRGQPESYYVSGIERSAHRDTTCVECHVDFNYTDQASGTPLWRINVGLACEGCHDDEEHGHIVAQYRESIHGQLISEGTYTSATCASCHGGHDIARLDTDAARRELHFASQQMCGGCHSAEWNSYDDYYHGRAYKRGAASSPACWDCHGSHEVLQLADPASMMYPVGAVTTCGSCHPGSDEAFIEHAADLIHGRATAVIENPLLRLLRSWTGRG